MTDNGQDSLGTAPELKAGRVSLTLDQVRDLKRQATHGATFADRVSLGLAVRILDIRQRLGEDHHVLHEINVLEGIASNSTTKPEAQFRHPPLHPLWHKHFSTPRHLIHNINLHWGINQQGNRHLTNMIEKVASEYGDQPLIWQNKLVQDFVLGGLHYRTSHSFMTGDWIIFAKDANKKYYLDLACHEEGHAPERLLAKLRGGSAWEFPSLFEQR